MARCGPMSREEREELEQIKLELGVGDDLGRPRTRGECAGVSRPCPFVGCQYNNFLDVDEKGVIHFRHPDKEPGDMDPRLSCALDVADRWGTKATTALVVQATGTSRNTASAVIRSAQARFIENMDFTTVDALLDAIDEREV